MKTVIEMAREAGFSCLLPDEAMDMIGGVFEGDSNITNALERFAALVREDEREKIALAHKIRPRGKSVYQELLAEREKQQVVSSKMEHTTQEPVAWYGLVMEAAAELELASYAIQQDSDSKRSALNAATWVREQAKKLRSANPPTAALAARQMRDAAVKVCREYCQHLLYDRDIQKNWHRTKMANDTYADLIAALPVPEVQWRDLTDEEIEAIAKENDTWSLFKSLRIFDFANAVIAKFKEKQLPTNSCQNSTELVEKDCGGAQHAQ